MKAARKKAARAPRKRSASKTVKTDAQRMLRVNVRAPSVRVRTTAPNVQVEAPTVQIKAPKPLIIPAPIVKVDVEAEERPDEICLKGLRRELRKCMQDSQSVELILTSDWGPDSRSYRVGTLVRVDEGLLELRTQPSAQTHGGRIMIPLNRILAIIPGPRLPATEAEASSPPFVERTGE